MIDSECARLILRHHAIVYREQDRIFGWVSLLALIRGGTGQIPLVHGDGLRASGPRLLAEALDRRQPNRRLLPADATALAQAQADWTLFNQTLGTAVAVFAYHHLLPERALMTRCFGRTVTATGRAMMPVIYPALRALFGWALTLTTDHMNNCARAIGTLLDETDARIADGRGFLGGDAVALSDLALASALAPLLLPPDYAAQLPALADMPTAVQMLVAETRKRRVAALVYRVYAAVALSTSRGASG